MKNMIYLASFVYLPRKRIEFVKYVKKMNPKTKVLLMTAFEINEMEFTRVLPKPKIDGFIQKPISMRKLNSIIDKY
jgi:two-component SAPR family response regulator